MSNNVSSNQLKRSSFMALGQTSTPINEPSPNSVLDYTSTILNGLLSQRSEPAFKFVNVIILTL